MGTKNRYWLFDTVIDGKRHQTKARYTENTKEKAFDKISKKKKQLIEELTIDW